MARIPADAGYGDIGYERFPQNTKRALCSEVAVTHFLRRPA
jgi:hypothetical protein